MAVFTVVTPGVPAPDAVRPAGVFLASSSGVKLALPFAPPTASLDGLADKWDRVERLGRQPLVRYNSAGLPEMPLSLLLANLDGSPVDNLIATLRSLARGSQLITLSGLTSSEEGPWRIDSLGIAIEQRTPDNSGVERATASLQLVAAVDVSIAATRNPLPRRTGPLTGGVADPPVTPAPTGTTYTVVKGDTLWAISGRFYGNPTKWPKIADANASTIRNPNLIYPGQVIRIPPA